jgi:hypothetical protein
MFSRQQLEKQRFENDLHRTLYCIIAHANDPAQLAYPLDISASCLDHICASLWIADHDHAIRQGVAAALGADQSLTAEETLDAAVREAYSRCTDVEVVRQCITALAKDSLETGDNKLNVAVLAKLLFVTSPDMSLDEESEANPKPAWRLRTARMMARRTELADSGAMEYVVTA